MSSGFQHKLYNYQEIPPAGTWQKIAAELDDSAISSQFPAKLGQAQVTPPAHIWQNISATLDQMVLAEDYSSKLSEMEVSPPDTAWAKIRQSLDAESQQHRKIPVLARYAAAAVMIGVLAWGGVKLLNSKSGETTVAKQELPATNVDSALASADQLINTFDETLAVNDMAASIEEARNDAALEASKKTFAKLDVATTRSKVKNAAGFVFSTANFEPAVTRGFGPGTADPAGIDISNRYIILMTPDGNIIRMSKKLKELVCCVSGEEQDKDCIDQMKKWRERLANPSANHSSSNFMDILSLMNSMQEN